MSAILTVDGSNSTTTLSCPAGKTVLSGAWSAANSNVQVWLSAPNSTYTGWQFGMRENVSGNVQVTVIAICATVR